MPRDISLKYFIKERTPEDNKEDSFFDIPYIKKGIIELREYQKNIINNIQDKNTLVVLPTGLGKTIIAIVVAALRLYQYPWSSVLVLAPTKPLVNQHSVSFKKIMDLEEDKFIMISGSVSKEKRKQLWNKKGIFFATPQTVKNDIEEGILSLKNFSLIVFDEAHRSVGDYAYTFIAKKYVEESKHSLILGLTASPGGEVEKIGSVIGNLFIENVEVKSYSDPDVRPYIKDIKVDWIMVELSEDIKHVDNLIRLAIRKRADFLLDKGFISSRQVSKRELLDLQKKIGAKLSEDKSDFLFYVQGIIGQLVKLTYSLELVETQGLKQFIDYYEKLKDEKHKTKSLKTLLEDEDFTTAYLLAKKLVDEGILHPKIERIKEIIEKLSSRDSKVIIFTQYVETAKILVDNLKDKGAVLFIGQRKGYTQRKQLEIIEKFRKGDYKILVATSVAEEGLDIPAVDYVIFYEPIPSEIRSIQRRGRTGRFDEGNVIILITKKTLDEAYYWSSIAKERNMRRTLHLLKRMFLQHSTKVVEGTKISKMPPLTSYSKSNISKVTILVDYREEKLYESLKMFSSENVIIRKDNLSVGDVLIDNNVVIERKSAEDFANSIIDGRLFSQLDRIVYSYDLPLLIIEGDVNEMLKKRKIHENVIRGIISKVAIDYHVPIIWTKDIADTSRYIYFISKRFLTEENRRRKVKIIRRMSDENDKLVAVLSSIEGLNTTLAERMLYKFKTLKNIANATIDALKKVEGIGDKKAKNIFETFNKEYKKDNKEENRR